MTRRIFGYEIFHCFNKAILQLFQGHCPFLHDKPKDSPLVEPVFQNLNTKDCSSTESHSIGVSKQQKSLESSNSLKTKPDVSKIIVNKNKIAELKSNHVISKDIGVFTPVSLSINCDVAKKHESNRVVLPPKSRLGIKIDQNQEKKRSVKERLGYGADARHNCEIYELDGDCRLEDIETDVSLEEKTLREGAIKTMDLRNRLSKKDTFPPEHRLKSIIQSQSFDTQENKRLPETNSDPPMTSGLYGWRTDVHTDTESYYESDEEYDTASVARKSKKSKKEKKKKEKSKKKEKKEHKAEKLKRKKLKAEKAKLKINSKNINENTKQSTNDNEIIPEELELEDISTLESQKHNQQNDKKRKIEVTSTKGLSSKTVAMTKTTYDNKRAKILKNISNAVDKKKESVRSVLNDVDSLLKSAENQNLLDAKDNIQAESDDVMKQLDEIINS